MSPIIHLIRHAQGEHNISSEGHAMRDAQLTADGVRQCSRLESEFPAFHNIDLIVASPIKRTVWTALHSFDTRIDDNTLQVIALPELQATSDRLCDTGSSPEDVAKEFNGMPVDLSLVVPGWDSKQGKWAPEDDAIFQRAEEATAWLRSRPEKEIAVVTHRGMIPYLVHGWTEDDRCASKDWKNTEYHTCEFTQTNDGKAHLIETPKSRERRLRQNTAESGHTQIETANM